MSVVAALSVVLILGFVVTALIGFVGWRQRMRDSVSVKSIGVRL